MVAFSKIVFSPLYIIKDVFIFLPTGNTETNVTTVTWCGEMNPISITSSGQYLRVTFTTDDRNNNYRGITLNFTFFGNFVLKSDYL